MKIKSKKGFAAKWAVLIGLTIAIVAAIIIAVVVAKNNNGNEVVDTSSTTIVTATAADTTVKETETTVTTTVTQAVETTKENITVTSTKAAEVKTTVKPTATPTKEAVNFTDVNKTYYALSNGTVRYEPYDEAGSECRMTPGEEVFVMAKGDNGWWKVKYNGNVRYVWYQNLTENKPTTAAPTKKQSSGNSGNGGSNNNSGSGSPKPGDRKVVNGQAYVYDDLWGWIRDTGSGLCDDGITNGGGNRPDEPGYAH